MSISKNIKTHHEGTWEVLDSFYEDRLNAFKMESDNGDPRINALSDVESIYPDYTFEGEELDLATKDLWVQNKKEQLLTIDKEQLNEQYNAIFGGHEEEDPLERIEHQQVVIERLVNGDSYEDIQRDFVDDYYTDLKGLSLGELEAEAMTIQENAGVLSDVVHWDNRKFLQHVRDNDRYAFHKLKQLKHMHSKKEHESYNTLEITNVNQALHLLKECGWDVHNMSTESLNVCARVDVLHEWDVYDEKSIIHLGNQVLNDLSDRFEKDGQIVNAIKSKLLDMTDGLKNVKELER